MVLSHWNQFLNSATLNNFQLTSPLVYRADAFQPYELMESPQKVDVVQAVFANTGYNYFLGPYTR